MDLLACPPVSRLPGTPSPSIRGFNRDLPSHKSSRLSSRFPTPQLNRRFPDQNNNRTSSKQGSEAAYRGSSRRQSYYSQSSAPAIVMLNDPGDTESFILTSTFPVSPALCNREGDRISEQSSTETTTPRWYQPELSLLAIKFVYFFVYANTACLIPYFVTFYYEWGLTATEQSLIQAAVPFFGFLVRPVIGRIADVTKMHRAVFAACCLW